MLQQNFAVLYKNNTFYVDPSKLYDSSRKFQNLILPYVNQHSQIAELQLRVRNEKFSDRNMDNFLKLCQNLPTDCADSEIKEICEIAKMFQADQIYNSGLNFVRSSIDPNFDVQYQEFNPFNGEPYLIIFSAVKNHKYLNELNSIEFDDDNNNTYYQTSNQENININKPTFSEKSPINNTDHNVIYVIKTTYSSVKLPVYQFIANGQVEFSAKQKNDLIVIGQGQTIHLNKDRSNHVGQISMLNGGVNIVSCQNQQYKVKYIYLPGPQLFSIESEFLNNGTTLHWKPKQPKYNNQKNSYSMPLHGEYHHAPMKSVKNTVLINDNGQTVFIARKISLYEFEIECNPNVSHLNVFALALTHLLGPNESYLKMIKD